MMLSPKAGIKYMKLLGMLRLFGYSFAKLERPRTLRIKLFLLSVAFSSVSYNSTRLHFYYT